MTPEGERIFEICRHLFISYHRELFSAISQDELEMLFSIYSKLNSKLGGKLKGDSADGWCPSYEVIDCDLCTLIITGMMKDFLLKDLLRCYRENGGIVLFGEPGLRKFFSTFCGDGYRIRHPIGILKQC